MAEYWLEPLLLGGRVYRDGEVIGHFWEDPKSEGYAAFKSGQDKAVARPKTVRGCILKITDGEWSGLATTEREGKQ